MKSKATKGFLFSTSTCLLAVCFTVICILLFMPAALKKEVNATKLVLPVSNTIDPFFLRNPKIAHEQLVLPPHTMVFELASQALQKRVFKYKLPNQTLKVLYVKNRVAILYKSHSYPTRRQTQRSLNQPYDAISGKITWQLFKQNNAYLLPLFFFRMQRGDISSPDDPLANRFLPQRFA